MKFANLKLLTRSRSFLGLGSYFLLIAIVMIAYWQGLYGSFFFDDEVNILQSEGIKLQEFSLTALKAALASGHSGPLGRAVAQLSFALNFYFSGLDPFVFKATNLVIHALSGGLVFLISIRLFNEFGSQFSRRPASLAALPLTAIWLLHPIQLTTVLLVVQRMTGLSAFFVFAGFYFHILGRSCQGGKAVANYFLAWGLLWPLAMFSKETGALFPLFVLAWELIVRRATSGRLDGFARFLSIGIGAALVFFLCYAFSPAGQWLWMGYEFRAFSLLERVLTEGRILWLYLDLIVLPVLGQFGLYHDDLIVSKTLLVPWTTLPAMFGCFVLTWLVWQSRKQFPLVSFGLAWFLIGHLMESTVLPLELAHEHRNYLPLFGVALAVVSFAFCFFEGVSWRRTIIAVSLVSFFAYITVITALRANQFGDEVRRTQIEAQHHPASARAQYDAGMILSRFAAAADKDAPVYGISRRHFELAMEVDPAFKMGGLGMIYIDCLRGGGDRQLIRELSSRLEYMPFPPGDTAFFFSLKEMQINRTACLGRQEVDELFTAAFRNIRIANEVKAKLYSWHADYLWLSEHDLPEARISLEKSLQLLPQNSSNRFKWAQLSLFTGDAKSVLRLLDAIEVENLSMSEQERYREIQAALKRSLLSSSLSD